MSGSRCLLPCPNLSSTPRFAHSRDERQLLPLILRASRRLPSCVDANPHCGLSARRSSGTIVRRLVDARRRSRGRLERRVFELTRPSTTTRSSGTCRSGSNVPDRSSSYSSRKRSKLRAAEHLLGDAVVAARRVEHALVVAAADVDAEGDARVPGDDRVVELDAGVEHLVRDRCRAGDSPREWSRRAAPAYCGASIWTYSQPRRSSSGDLAAREVDEVGEVGVAGRIGRARLVGIVVGRGLLRADAA